LEDDAIAAGLLLRPDANAGIAAHLDAVYQRQDFRLIRDEDQLIDRLRIRLKVLHNQRIDQLRAVRYAKGLKPDAFKMMVWRGMPGSSVFIPVGNGNGF